MGRSDPDAPTPQDGRNDGPYDGRVSAGGAGDVYGQAVSGAHQVLSRHWVEYGFGRRRSRPSSTSSKVLVLYVCGGIAIAAWTSGLSPFHRTSGSTSRSCGRSSSSGRSCSRRLASPARGGRSPATSGRRPAGSSTGRAKARSSCRRGPTRSRSPRASTALVRRRAVPVVHRQLVLALVLKGTNNHGIPNAGGVHGALRTWNCVLISCAVRVAARQDVYLAARSEQYMPAIVFFAFFRSFGHDRRRRS